jgi:hypothetical protein
MLKDDFVCGYKDIENKKWAGSSGKHEPDGQAVDTSNGAGPHNIQIFVLTPDGIVLTCLPGYWHSQDLASELTLAEKLNQVWQDPNLSRDEKNRIFTQMQLAHLSQHPKAEHQRSQLQGFDVQYEAQHKLYKTDVFYDPHAINPATKKVPPGDVKTADVIMHERMARRPFEQYEKFDVAAFSDYGKPMYDKQEDFRMANGQIAPGTNFHDEKLIGNDPRAHPIKTEVTKESKSILRQTLNTVAHQGIRALLSH